MACKEGCQDIEVQKCDDQLCDHEIDATCVNVVIPECFSDLVSGDTGDTIKLQDIIDAICNLDIGGDAEDHCPCPVSTYTIDDVCEVFDSGGTQELLVTLTPNFDLTTPTYIDVFINGFKRSLITELITSVENGTQFTFTAITTTTSPPLEGTVSVQVVDNNGNYSDVWEREVIPACT